jgi:hypothetical protein
MKRLVLLFGVLGLVGCFLPLVAGLSWFDLRHFDQGWTVWLVVLAFAIPTYVGATSDESDRATAIAAAGSFGYLAYKFNTDVFDLVFHGSIGGIMMGLALIGGAATSLLALAATRQSK